MPFSGHWFWIVIVLTIVLIIWGPGKMPEVGQGMGRAIREFKNATNEVRSVVDPVASASPITDPAPAAPAAPPVVAAMAPAAPVVPPSHEQSPGGSTAEERRAAG